MWILIIAMLIVPSSSKKDQWYHPLSIGIDNKDERIIGGSFVSAVLYTIDVDALWRCVVVLILPLQ